MKYTMSAQPSHQKMTNLEPSPDIAALSPFELCWQIRTLRTENETLRQALDELSGRYTSLDAEYKEFQSTYQAAVNRLVISSEYQDDTIDRHVRRIGMYSAYIAEKIGMSKDEIRAVELASPMHDIGKIGIPRTILMKQGRLDEEEFAIIKMHTVIGGNMLGACDSHLLRTAREIILSHHENWDGTGYPLGSGKKMIPLSGRIVGLVDAFDALTSRRPHKTPYPIDMASDIIFQQRGQKFDPELVDILQNNLDKLIRIKSMIEGPENMPNGHFVLSERDSAE